jgi:hypothetical protein
MRFLRLVAVFAFVAEPIVFVFWLVLACRRIAAAARAAARSGPRSRAAPVPRAYHRHRHHRRF